MLCPGQNVNKGLLNIRAIPTKLHLPSPARIMFGRPGTCTPSRSNTGNENHREHLERRQNDMTSQDGTFRRRDLYHVFALSAVIRNILQGGKPTYEVFVEPPVRATGAL